MTNFLVRKKDYKKENLKCSKATNSKVTMKQPLTTKQAIVEVISGTQCEPRALSKEPFNVF